MAMQKKVVVSNERISQICEDLGGNLSRADKNLRGTPVAPHIQEVKARFYDVLVCLEELVEARTVIAELRAEVERLKAAAVPEGWKLVPVEPTPEIIRAAGKTHCLPTDGWEIRIYQSMLAAAPQPPTAEPKQ